MAQETVALSVREPLRVTPEEFCARYADKVARFASIAAGRDADPDDIAQEALLKAIRALDRFDPARGPYEAWIWRIVVNTARDATRKARLRELLEKRLPRADEAGVVDVEEAVIQRVSSAELYAAIGRLRPRDRELLALRFASDLSTAEVGQITGSSAETARRAIGRALERLRAQLVMGGIR